MRKLVLINMSIALVFLSCKRKSLPIEPGILGEEVIKENRLPTVTSVVTLDGDRVLEDFDTLNPNVQDIIFIYFSEPMDEKSLLASIELKVVGGRSTEVPNGTWNYEKTSNRAVYILSQNFGFTDSTKYEVIIKSTAKDLSGNPLDGNRNGYAEGSLDDYHNTLWTRRGNLVPDPDYRPPSFRIPANLISPNPLRLGGLIGINDSIHVRFYVNDIDRNSVNGAFELYEYESGLKINIGNPRVTIDSPLNRTDIIFSGFSLNYSKVYKLIINTNLKDIAGNSLDGNNNGISEKNEIDRVQIFFATVTQSLTRTDYPSYLNSSRSENLIVFWFDELMDTSTINYNTVKVFRNYLQDAVPFNMKKIQHHGEKRTYIELTLISNKSNPVWLWINKNVKDLDGLKLDSNGDNIGGVEPVDNKIVNIP
ncbi:MAG: Ig-like domain-containing protein [Candidatus Hydrothermales bacterium]